MRWLSIDACRAAESHRGASERRSRASRAAQLCQSLAPWDPSPERRIIVDDFPTALRTAAELARRLGRQVLNPGDELRILYLTTQEIAYQLPNTEKQSVFAALLKAFFASGVARDYHMLAMTNYDVEPLLDVVEPTYFTQKAPTQLYQLYSPDTTDVLNEADQSACAGHEMCLS